MKILALILFALCFFPAVLKAQEKIDASFETSDGKVFITYELIGDVNLEYDVQIKLKRKSISSFELTPALLTGDFGTGKFAGGKRSIIWTLGAKEENQLDGDDFYFEVLATAIKKGGSTWYYYAGAAVGGVIAAIVVLLSKTEVPPVATTTFPSPAGRPGN